MSLSTLRVQYLAPCVLILSVALCMSPFSFQYFGNTDVVAKPKSDKKKKRKDYDRRRRQAAALIKEGHPTVELSVRTNPRVAARVYHGKELLGTAPFSFKWPKDTGALDLVLKASGYLPVNTRLYTYRDDKVTVDMFKESEGHKLFGYRKRIDAPKEEDEE